MQAKGENPRPVRSLGMTSFSSMIGIHVLHPALLLASASICLPVANATAAPHPVQTSDDAATPDAPDALREAARGRAEHFYQAAGWRPVWSEPARAALASSLADRARHGLDHVAFIEKPETSVSAASTEVGLTEGALRYARALANGLVNPETLHDAYTLPRAGTDLERGLIEAIGKGTLQDWFSGLAPQDPEYVRLSQAYLDLRDAPDRSEDDLIGGRLLKAGDADPRVPDIVSRLAEGEYLQAGREETLPAPGGASSDTPVYTQNIAEAVARLQRDYGLTADGIVGPDTLRVLNLRAGDRARAIAVALERRRWLARTPPATRIDVNTAAARLHYYRDGVLVDTRRVVVGKPGTETPPLQSPIYRLVANPTWTVPKSIQNGELAHVGPDYLQRHNMELRNGWIVQGSGPDNALGLVKFDMENNHAIYLHDTSAPELFGRSNRHRSHGCVRVEDAPGFAEMLAQDEGVDGEWALARAGGEQRFVELPRRIPVRLLYHNVFVTPEGGVVFRTDPYGWNAPVAKALGFDDGKGAILQSAEPDIAP